MSATTTKKSKRDAIVDRLTEFVSRYAIMTEHQLLVYVLWILHTWQFSPQCHTPNTTPYLYVTSQTKGAGKTLVGKDLVEVLARNPIGVNNVTEATLFHLCAMQSTIMVDEVDQMFSGAANRPIVSVLNAGYRRGGKVPRMDPKTKEVALFPVFCPKALIGIDNKMLAETTRDRCLPLRLQKATREQLDSANVVPFYHYEVEEEVEEIASELHAWAEAHTDEIRGHAPKAIEALTSGREWEIARPLVQVAKAAGVETEAREALAAIFTAERIDEISIQDEVLAAIYELFEEQEVDRITTREILAMLAETDDRFADWNGKKLAVVLAPYGAKGGAVRFGNKVDRGYMRSTFLSAWREMGLVDNDE